MVWFVLKCFSVEAIQVEFSDPVAASDVKRYRRFAGADLQVVWWAVSTGNVRVNGASGASGIPPDEFTATIRHLKVGRERSFRHPRKTAGRRAGLGVLAGARRVDYVDDSGLIGNRC
jgi:hypothetical protein